MKFNFGQVVKKEIHLSYIFLILFILVSAGFLFLDVNEAQSAIVTNDISTNSCDCNQLIISDHQISQKRPLLIVGVGLEDGGADKVVDSITYNGEPLTRLAQEVDTTKARTDVWYLEPSNNPPSGQYDVVINIQKNNRVSAGAITINGVDHSNPIDFGAVQSDSGIALNSLISVHSDLDDVVMNVATAEKTSIIFDSSQTERWNVSVGGGNYRTAASTKDGVGGNTSMNVEFSDSQNFSHIGFNINVAPQCDDGIDNDNDGQTDYPKDDGCQFLSDDNEFDTIGGSENIKIKYSGFAYPNGTVTFYMEDDNGNTCSNIENFIYRTGGNARFNQDFDLCFKEDPILGIQATDSEGRKSVISEVERSYVGNTYFVEDVVFPPTIDFEQMSVLKGETVKVFGRSVPNSEIEVILDGTFINRTSSNGEGYWEYVFDTEEFRVGSHVVRARMTSPQESFFSRRANFEVSDLPYGKFDLNNDYNLNIKDVSIFLFRWSRDDTIRNTIDFDNSGVVDISDFSIFLREFSYKFYD